MATATTEHYRTYSPEPFTRADRDTTTILFGGLHWRIERIIQGVFEGGGYKARILPVATKEDLLTGREVADIGQCCPTSFTTGNLVNFLKKEAKQTSVAEVNKKFVYLTAGSCGACRFGQYHSSYELALRNTGLDKFRMFLMAQDNLDQNMGDGLDLNLPMTLGVLWGIFCTDLVQDLEYQIRPYEVLPGQTTAVVKECVEYLYQAFRDRPKMSPKKSVLWHLTTPYFVRAVREVHRRFSEIEVDRLRVKPIVKITGEFYLQTVEGDPNYNIHKWLEAEGAQVYPAAITIWMEYLLRLGLQRFEDYSGIEKHARLKLGLGRVAQGIYRLTVSRLRRAMGDLPHESPSQFELRRLAAPYFHRNLDGGEGDMLVGKSLWAFQKKKAHMICELSPYSCMPNTMSIGAMAGVIGKHPEILYAPLEIKGDAEVHALSRCQMILTEAKKRAQREFDDTLAAHRPHAGTGAGVPERASGDEEGDVQDPARRHRDRHGRQDRPARGQQDGPDRGGGQMKFLGVDVGSTTVKAVVMEDGKVTWQDYQRHNTRQAEKVVEFLERMETEAGVTVGQDRIFFTGSGAGFLAPLAGAKLIQEVVAVAACVERQHPDVRFVSEIGGEDMKTIFFTATGTGRSKQVYMQSACSGGTGTFIEKTARKLQVPSEKLAELPYEGMSLHKVSSKCGIFAETDANTLVKTGVPVEEIIASLFEAVVYQNLATLTKGNTPTPEVLLLGGPNLFFKGLQEAWRHHLAKLWSQRKLDLGGREPAELIVVPAEALYYACLGCIEIGQGEKPDVGVYLGRDKLKWWVETGQHEAKAKEGARGLITGAGDLATFVSEYVKPAPSCEEARAKYVGTVLLGCDFGSTTAKAVVLSEDRELLFSCYALSKGNPIEDAQSLFRQVRRGRLHRHRRAGAHRLRQGSAEGRAGRRHGRGGDGGPRHRRAALLRGRGCDLRRGRHRRQDHDPAAGHGGRLPSQLAVLVRQRRLPAGRGRALQRPAQRVRGSRVRGQVDAEPDHGLRRLLAVGHRQPAAQGLVGRGDHGRAGRGAAGQRVDLRRPAAKSKVGRPQVRAAGRHPPQHGGGEGPGRLHPQQGARRRGRPASVLRRGGRHRRRAVRGRLAQGRREVALPRLSRPSRR